MKISSRNPYYCLVVFAAVILLISSACSISLFDFSDLIPLTPTPLFPPPPTATPQPMAEITFEVVLPAPLLPGETLILSILDEVTGLALNASNYVMQARDAQHYTRVVPFPMNSVVKYRYVRQVTLPINEDDSADRPVRYRMYQVTGPGTVQDTVSSWSDSAFSGPVGRISGQVINAANGSPIPNILVAAGGLQTLTDSTGGFFLESLPPGTHNVVAYAMDGAYQPFQQGATVSADRRTPVNISMSPASLVNVVFTVVVPRETVPSAPIRLAGNLLQLGNTFADLRGGVSSVATRMPVLQPLPDGRYTISLMLPAGADIRYKYTLGDGFWNAEHRQNQQFVVRQIIVPQTTYLVQDMVETWQSGPSASILFEVSVPANTPLTDVVSLQINPYGWTEPFPMWPMGNNRWTYKLFSPLNMIGSFEYRYCRNEQCGVADDVATLENRGRSATTTLTSQDFQDTITGWVWWQPAASNPISGIQVQARDASFLAGIEMQADYHPTWQPWMTSALQSVQGLGVNWVVLTPTWSFTRTSPLVFSPLPGNDPLWADTNETIGRARALNLNVALFPSPHFPVAVDEWWASAPRDAAWWDAWFEHYRLFAFYHADQAAQAGAQALILGGEWIGPALPGGTLMDGGGSNVPSDAETRWRVLIADVRRHFTGKIYWAMPYSGGLVTAPNFASDLDGIYLLWQAPLSSSATPTIDAMQAEANRLLDSTLLPFQNSLQKPLFIAVAYPSVSGAAADCLPDGVGGCLHWSALNHPNPDNPAFILNMQAQSDIYQALLGALNGRTWISGFISRGYYPPVALQDKSASIRGKTASDYLLYWFPRLTGVIR